MSQSHYVPKIIAITNANRCSEALFRAVGARNARPYAEVPRADFLQFVDNLGR